MENNNSTTTKTESTEIETFALPVAESKPFEYPEIDDGEHNATVKKLTLSPNMHGKNGDFDMLKWYFDVDGKEIVGTSSAKVTTLSKAYGWIKSITGIEPKVGNDFNPNDLKNKTCRIIIKHETVTNNFNGVITTMQKPVVTEVFHAKSKK